MPPWSFTGLQIRAIRRGYTEHTLSGYYLGSAHPLRWLPVFSSLLLLTFTSSAPPGEAQLAPDGLELAASHPYTPR